MILVALAVVTARLADAPPLASANDRSRWCTVWSLVERNTWQIDEIRQHPGWDTIDIVRVDGHFYSTKPSLLPWAASHLYRAIKTLTGWNLLDHTDQVVHVILFLINVLPMALALTVLSRIVSQYCEDRFSQRFIMAVACWGTMLTPFLTVFNNHTPAATFLIFALAPLLRIVCDDRESSLDYLWCGLATGLAVTQELPAAAFAACSLWLLGRRNPQRTLIAFLPALLIPVAASLYANYVVTGGPLPFYSGYGTGIYNFVHEGVPSYWSQPTGIDRPRDSLLAYLLHCTLGHHGIFSLTPVFLLSLAGWFQKDAWRKSGLLALRWVPPALTVIVLGFYLTRTENYNYSGLSVALRWMLWLVPLWVFSLIPVFNEWGSSREFRSWALGLLVVSTFSAWYPYRTPWSQNWIYRSMEQAGWIDYSEPPLKFRHPHFSWISNLPEGDVQPDYWLTFAAQNTDGQREELRLSDAGPGEGGRWLRVQHSRAGESINDVTYLLDAGKFAAGSPVDEFLKGKKDGGELTEQDRQFFRGLPRSGQYITGNSTFKYQYFTLPVRQDAFECHPAFAHETHPDESGADRQYIRDVWYCAEVPYGVLAWEERVVDSATRNHLSRKSWRVSAAGKFFSREEASLRP